MCSKLSLTLFLCLSSITADFPWALLWGERILHTYVFAKLFVDIDIVVGVDDFFFNEKFEYTYRSAMVRECVCVVFLLASILLNLNARPRYYVMCGECECVCVCVLAPVCYRDIFAVHTQTRLHTAQAIATKSHSISIGLGCFLLLLYVWASSPLRSTHTQFSFFFFFFFLIHQCVKRSLTRLFARLLSQPLARVDVLVCSPYPWVCALREWMQSEKLLLLLMFCWKPPNSCKVVIYRDAKRQNNKTPSRIISLWWNQYFIHCTHHTKWIKDDGEKFRFKTQRNQK